VSIARRNLFEGKTRFIISVGGVALAMLLIIALDGVFAGSMKQTTTYIDNSDFQVVAAQEGVKNMHMNTSFFSASKINEIKKIKGVQEINPILYLTDYIKAGPNRNVAYIIGYNPDKRTGGPWEMDEGSTKIKRGEIIIDEQIAYKNKVKIGDKVSVLGADFKIGGLSRGSVTLVNSIAFIRLDDFERARRVKGIASYLFIKLKAGEKSEAVVEEINNNIKGVTAQTKEEFSSSEQQVISDMSIDIIRIMNFITFLIGLAVLGLTVYTATLSKVKEYGVMKALGAKNRKLYLIVFEQGIISVAVGFIIAVILAFITIGGLTAIRSNIPMIVTLPSLFKVISGSVIISIFAASIPILRISKITPAEVFRGK
jgi:putative ABC transport system permease protein